MTGKHPPVGAKLARCSGTNRDGSPCSAQARPGRDRCAWHDPALDEQRAEWRQRGGAGRSHAQRARKALGEATDLLGVQAKLVDALGKVERGELDAARAQAMAALGRAIVAVAVPADLAQRVAELERLAGGGAAS